MARAACLGLEAVPGMETTLVVDGCDVHLVCLLFDHRHPVMRCELERLAASRRERNLAMVDKLAKAGLPISMEDMACYGKRAISRGHMAQVLIAHGCASTPKEAIVRYMTKGTVGYVRRRTPDPAAFIGAVHEAGGLCFVAHLHQIDPADPAHCVAICRRLLALGADGLETLYSEYDDFWRQATQDLARETGALCSGGSDFHGDLKPGLELGTGYGALAVPYAFLEAMKQRLK